MKNLRLTIQTLSLLALLASCDDSPAEPDASTEDGGTCAVSDCTTEGITCSGDTLVTCAANADGCLVEASEDCSIGGGSCDSSGVVAACMDDPCAAIPAADRCTTEARTCTGDSLDVCAPNADGCLVNTTTDCASSPGGVCDASGTMPVCALPADPCLAVPIADRCDTAGTTCADGTTLDTCAPNAFGCLVSTSTDCSSRAGGTCDGSGVPAVCVFTGDPCAGIVECSDTSSVACEGPELVRCGRDAFGCFVENRTDCASAPFGFCDAVGSPNTCSTAATDPCMGMTVCSTAGRTCDVDTLRICAPNAFGCNIETPTDCTTSSEVCDDTGPLAVCVDPCSLVATCPAGGDYCDGQDAVTCAVDSDGCLAETARTPCTASETCGVDTSVASCSADTLCPDADRMVLDCSSGVVTSTTVGGSSSFTTYDSSCTSGTEYGGNERVFRFRNTGGSRVGVTIRSSASSFDYDLFVMSSSGGTAACDGSLACVDSGTTASGNEMVAFTAAPGQEFYVVNDLFGVPTTRTSAFSLAISCVAIACGNGVIEIGETCDDGNTADSDGCSSACAPEAGYFCSGAPSICSRICGDGMPDPGEACDDGNSTDGDGCSSSCAVETGYACTPAPSACTMLAPNGDCATPTAVTVPSTLMGDTLAGGTFPIAAGTCGPPPMGNSLFYSVSVPAGGRVVVTATDTGPGFPIALTAMDSCGAADCSASADGPGPQTIVLTNSTGAAVTHIVAVRPAFPPGGAFTIDFVSPVCGNGTVETGEECDDGGTVDGNGCSAVCTTEVGYSCTGSPSVCTRLATVTTITAMCAATTGGTDLAAIGDDVATAVLALPFTFTHMGDAVTHFSATSNGFIQLWPSSAGTPSRSLGNTSIPSSGVPNGFVAAFWDDLRNEAATTFRSIVTGTAPNRVFVVEWGDWGRFGEAGNVLTFQVMLYETTNVIEIHYCSLAGPSANATGASATVGIESLTGATGVEIGFNTAGTATSGSGYRLTP